MEGSVLCNVLERRSGLRRFINERLSIFGNTPWSHQPNRISALLLLVALAAVIVPCLSAQSYVPAIVSTASTTLYSSSASISPGRVSVDKAGNTFFIVTGGSTSTLMEIPAASPSVTNTAPITLITGLGQYNAYATFVDVNGNLWVSDGNGKATIGSSTDYISLIEIPASGGIPNTAALIAAGGESVTVVDATHCSSTSTSPCTWQNYKFNSTGTSPIMGPQLVDFYVDGAGNVYFVDAYDNTSSGHYNRIAKVNPFTSSGNATLLADNLTSNSNAQIAVDGAGNVYYADSSTVAAGSGNVSLVSGGALTTVGTTAALTTALIASGTATGVSADSYGNLYISSKTQISEVPFEGTALNFVDEFGIAAGLTNNIVYGGSVDAHGNYYYASYTNIQQVQI